MTLDHICAEIAKQLARGRLVERVVVTRRQLDLWWEEARRNGSTLPEGELRARPGEIMGVRVEEVEGKEPPRLVVWLDRVEVAL